MVEAAQHASRRTSPDHDLYRRHHSYTDAILPR
jgi:hypothetical protein